MVLDPWVWQKYAVKSEKVFEQIQLYRDDGSLLPDAYLHLFRKKGS